MQKNIDFATKEKLRKAAKKTAMNTIAWHGLSAVAMLFLLVMFRAYAAFSIILGIAVVIEVGLVVLAFISLKNRLKEIEEDPAPQA